MTLRTGFLLTCATGALAIGAGSLPAALAADMAVKAPPVAVEAPGWWWNGEAEIGGWGFLNNPSRNGIPATTVPVFQTGNTLAKFYEYNGLRPGPFGNLYVAAGSNDGLYNVDFWAKNIGYDNQSYLIDLYKAGEAYLTAGWDETPHLYSTSALTLWDQVGNRLVLPAGLSNALFAAAGCGAVPGAQPVPVAGGCGSPLAAANAARVQSIINSNVRFTDLGIRRDTASAEYRWTPTEAWDIRAYYNHLHREGTQVDGVVFSPGTSGVNAQVQKPVNDTTDNYGMNAEYAGMSLLNKRYTFRVGYSGSTYRDEWASYTVENPFCGTTGFCARNGSPSNPLALMSLWPDNQANAVSSTLGADLPWSSRYMGTVSYNMMRQNQAFLPFTLNPLIITNSGNTATSTALPGLPATSLNGNVNTLLVNNVLTTQITPELMSRASYRYYDFDNDTPELLFKDWVLTDVKLASAQSAAYAPVQSLSISYRKQNAGEELVWRPNSFWNLGAAYEWERFDWTRADVNVTNENGGKVFADWKPLSTVTARASWQFSERRFDNYDYFGYVGVAQWPNGDNSTRYNVAMRQFYLDDRDRNKGVFQVAWEVVPTVTITPSFKIVRDEYHIAATEIGLTSSNSWNAGVEAAWLVTPDATLLFAYMREQYDQDLRSSTANGTAPLLTSNTYVSNIRDDVNTYMGAVNLGLIPGTLDLKLSYTLSVSKDSQPLLFLNGTLPATGQYPDTHNNFQRFDAIGKYRFDPDLVEKLGWKGEVFATLRYAFERDHATNWQNDPMQTYMYPLLANAGYMTWLAFDNPNYNVHLLAGSLTFRW